MPFNPGRLLQCGGCNTDDNQAPVVQKVDSTMRWIIEWIAQLVFQILICWIVIYPVDSTIRLLNNRGQAHIVQKLDCAMHLTEISPVDSTIDLLNNWGQKKNPNREY